MTQVRVKLEGHNYKAARAALEIMELYDLEQDTSYPFLDMGNWKSRRFPYSGYIFRHGRNRVAAPEHTHDAFFVVADNMKPMMMGLAVAETLRKALTVLEVRREGLIIWPLLMRGKLFFMGAPEDIPEESMVYWEVALTTITLLAIDKYHEICGVLDNGDHVLIDAPNR